MAMKFWKRPVAITAIRRFKLQSTPFNRLVAASARRRDVNEQNLRAAGSFCLVTRFETWRANRKYVREPIPDELWNSAADSFVSFSIRLALCPQPLHGRQSTGSRAPENGKSVSCDRSPGGEGSSHASREREPGLAPR